VAGAHSAIAEAISGRRPQILAHGPDALVSLPFLPSDVRSVAIVPLITAGDEGGTEVDGLLLAASEEPLDAVPDTLLAVSDLAAVAIRQSRLENALGERADWLDRMSNTDALTGLANRRTFDRMLQLELARAARQKATVGLALFEVDGLAAIRKRAGETRGDDILRVVASTLADQLRLIDTVGRTGAGTLAAICPGSPGPEAATRVRDAIAKLQPMEGVGPFTVSAGVAHSPDDGAEADALVASAERALAAARSQGNGSVALASEA
jgi:diguanylate cyclase (GGDEF)-like protein